MYLSRYTVCAARSTKNQPRTVQYDSTAEIFTVRQSIQTTTVVLHGIAQREIVGTLVVPSWLRLTAIPEHHFIDWQEGEEQGRRSRGSQQKISDFQVPHVFEVLFGSTKRGVSCSCCNSWLLLLPRVLLMVPVHGATHGVEGAAIASRYNCKAYSSSR